MDPLDAIIDELKRLRREREITDANIARLEQAAKILSGALHQGPTKVNVSRDNMQATDRSLSISAGHSKKRGDSFMAVIRSKGYTMRSLASELGTHASLLSVQRKGDRPIPRERAEKIQQLTGWPADAAHWPGGIVS